MKNIILGMTIFLMVILSLGIVFAMGDKDARRNEVQESLTSAIESTMETMFIKKAYYIEDAETFVADFEEALLVQLGTISDVTVNILEVDTEKGLLSVEIIERFEYMNGKQGSVAFTKTCIFE